MTNSERRRGQPGHILWACLLIIALANCPSAFAAEGGKPGARKPGDSALLNTARGIT